MKRKSIEVGIGNIKIGGTPPAERGGNPIAIQSMTNTLTADVDSTYAQIVELINAGSELVRITVNNIDAAKAVPYIKERLIKNGFQQPLIGDFHYNGHTLLTNFPDCASALDKYRINPGNVGGTNLVQADTSAHDYNFRTMIECALKYDKPVRIGVNWGSLDQELFTDLMGKNGKSDSPKSDREILYEAMVQSAINSAKDAEKIGLPKNRIVLSVKMSGVQDVIKAYTMLAERCDYSLHLGLTEAGMGTKGLVASTAALAVLLQQGIGDTIRVSLTPEPGASRTKEVEACQLILQTMGLRQFRPQVSSCPGCGRTSNDFYQRLAKEVNEHIAKKMPEWKQKYPGVESLQIAVMGCIVNGPGESKHADIGISLPGNTEDPIAPVYIGGRQHKVLKGEKIPEEFITILEDYIAHHF